ncbi:hypothetical protein [Streptosporangium subroseum]|uniref:hypothetical protein n=1 Tax=Streptosporangium subroseum TaxID=106412 RepID=UPI0030918466|nr:hypothetical protein OHB15_27995 [Streptosporangium subroseum]
MQLRRDRPRVVTQHPPIGDQRISAAPVPAGSAARNARHSASERLDGSTGQVAHTAAKTARRCNHARSARAASSSAMRRTRSGTYTPIGSELPQPNRRRAIHPLAGNTRPSPLLLAARSLRAVPVHRSVSTWVAMVWASAASQPTRRTSVRSPTTSPLASSAAR